MIKMIFFKIYAWSYSAGVVSYRYLIPLEIKNIQKSCIHNHDKKCSIRRFVLALKSRCSFVSVPSRYLEIQSIQKSCIYNHDKNVQFEDLYLLSSPGVVSCRYLHVTWKYKAYRNPVYITMIKMFNLKICTCSQVQV